ncbi:MAG: hypothetical protein LBQ33_04175, partial [Oscillospiraceae bacterium]|nr:hypothetical protein [Oscillospiraceae bacterium]
WRQLPTEAFSINGYLDSFDFIDMDGDGTEEIIVSSRLFLAEGAKSFTLLFPEADETGGVISRIRTQDKMDASGQIKLGINYTQLIFADLDGDGVDEACYTRLGMADAANNSVAGAFRYDAESKTLEALGEIPLDPNVSQHEQPKYLPLAGGRGAILFDAFKGETGVITELIYYDAQTRRLAAPFLDQETGVNMATFRAQRVLSRDFDGDGRVDVPSQYDMPGSSVYSVGSSAPTGFPLIQWSRVQADFSLQPYTKHLLYLGPNQWVQLPERLRDVVENPEGLGDELTVRGNPEDAQNTLHFYSWDQKTGHTVGKELFWLRIVGAGQRNALAEYEIMGEGRQRRLRLDFLETVRTSA